MKISSNLQENDPRLENEKFPSNVRFLFLTPEKGAMTTASVEKVLAKVRVFSDTEGVVIQLFDIRNVHGRDHLLSAIYHALRAEAEERSRTRDLSVDIARYAAGERQIAKAFDKVGLRKGTKEMVMLAFFPQEILLKQKMIMGELVTMLTCIGMEVNTQSGMKIGSERKREWESGNEEARENEKLAEALERMALLELKL